ncbi:MAG: DUF1304 domain-containing protein, partial [Pseudomonadota bacterium]
FIAALHGYIAWFEIFAWETRGPVVFSSFPPELFPQTVDMAANQGIYNAFLAIGLGWSLLIKNVQWRRNVATCFLAFVAIAGIVAMLTIAVRPGLIQTVPAGLALILLHLSERSQNTGSKSF